MNEGGTLIRPLGAILLSDDLAGPVLSNRLREGNHWFRCTRILDGHHSLRTATVQRDHAVTNVIPVSQ